MLLLSYILSVLGEKELEKNVKKHLTDIAPGVNL